MPALRLLAAIAVALSLATACSDRSHGAPDAGASATDAGPTSEAPPLLSAPLPAPPPPGASASGADAPAPAPRLPCPKGMVRVPGGLPPRDGGADAPAPVPTFCIDRWEAQLIDAPTGVPLSPYYPPDRRLAVQLAETWEKQREQMGSAEARQIPLPPLPEWQRRREVEPVATSRGGVVPNGYVSGKVAERACRNAGKRLCKHDEWVIACRGQQDRKYPYGAEYKQGACNVFRSMHPALALHDNASIGHLDPRLNLVKDDKGDPLLHRTGTTPACTSTWEGGTIHDMNGNLDEWVEDEHGRFNGGFFSRSRRDGCDQSITAHPKDYFDYSTGVRCCASEGAEAR